MCGFTETDVTGTEAAFRDLAQGSTIQGSFDVTFLLEGENLLFLLL